MIKELGDSTDKIIVCNAAVTVSILQKEEKV
jgi:hypothetical protein